MPNSRRRVASLTQHHSQLAALLLAVLAATCLTSAVAATMKVGDKIQDSAEYSRELQTSDGSTLTLASLAGKPLVLFFYPKASTPGCTKEACKFRDEYAAFQDVGAHVFGISSDSPAANKAFAEAQRLPFPLLTDPAGALRKSFGVTGNLLGLIPGRQTFVFGADGSCLLSFNSQMDVLKHVDQALAALKGQCSTTTTAS